MFPLVMGVVTKLITQPSYISSANPCAGVAAAAGELAKGQRYQDAVEEAGCDFIPLVVETFCVWLPLH